ncbi:hypothetical protein HYQ44_001753 [Verticillium longisporum]|nr:hypothetical protein HYQ44_001753 [Verticillium longisporum]
MMPSPTGGATAGSASAIGGLNSGQKAGIAIGSIAGAAFVAMFLVFLVRWRKRRSERYIDLEPRPPTRPPSWTWPFVRPLTFLRASIAPEPRVEERPVFRAQGVAEEPPMLPLPVPAKIRDNSGWDWDWESSSVFSFPRASMPWLTKDEVREKNQVPVPDLPVVEPGSPRSSMYSSARASFWERGRLHPLLLNPVKHFRSSK